MTTYNPVKVLAAEVSPITYCYHMEDAPNNKCYEGCATKDFKSAGMVHPGRCNPALFKVVTSKKTVHQCSDGMTNLKYCKAPKYPVVVNMEVLGEKETVWARFARLQEIAHAKETVDCRADKSSKPIAITFNNQAGYKAKVRGCLNQYACKPFRDCELALQDKATETIIIDASIKYMVLSFYGKYATADELYPDANLMWPKSYDIKAPKQLGWAGNTRTVSAAVHESPKMSSKHFLHPTEPHCEDLTGDFTSKWYKANSWRFFNYKNEGKCPSKFNFVNKKERVFAFQHRILGIKTPKVSSKLSACVWMGDHVDCGQ
jgi:hypothetical protein